MVEEVIKEFRALAAIPRATFHEEQAAAYVAGRGIEYGLRVERDEKNNVVIDKPAHPGCEHIPGIILQAHLDMVCKKEPGLSYDPVRDGIQLIESEDRITARGTTLGADNGIGVAVILQLLKEPIPCGPIRGIFTVEEEQGMGGARNLNASWVQGKYFVSTDWTSTRTSCIGCAASRGIRVKRNLRWIPPKNDTAFRLKLSGFTGGHSGLDIGKSKRNAVFEMIKILQDIKLLGIDIELAHIEGGTAGNVIPDTCTCIITAERDKAEELQELVAAIGGQLSLSGLVTDGSPVLTAERTDCPGRVLDQKGMREILDFVQSVPNGVLKPSGYNGGHIELSANIGKISVEDAFELLMMARGSEEQYLNIYYSRIQYLAFRYHMMPEQTSREPGFSSDPDGALIQKVCEIYKRQNKEELLLETIHAGLECGHFKQKNPELEMIVLGADLEGIHTTNETLYTGRLEVLMRLLRELLCTLE